MWAPDEPNDDGPGEDCAELRARSYGLMNDFPCSYAVTGLCEKKYEPWDCFVIFCDYGLLRKKLIFPLQASASSLSEFTYCLSWLLTQTFKPHTRAISALAVVPYSQISLIKVWKQGHKQKENSKPVSHWQSSTALN